MENTNSGSEPAALRQIGQALARHMTVTASSTQAGGLPPDVVMRLMVVPELRKLRIPLEDLSPDQYEAFLQALALRIVSSDTFRRAAFLAEARQVRWNAH